MGSVKVGFLHLLPQQQVVADLFHVDRGHRHTGALEGPIVEDLLGRKHVGPNWG